MKKISLFLLLLLCSCTVNNSLSKTCKEEIKNSSFKEKTTYKINYSGNDIIENVVIIKNYKSSDNNDITKDIKKTIKDYINKYGGTGIKYTINKELEDEFEIEFFIPVKSVDETILKDFKLEKKSVKLFKEFKKNNIECED